MPIPGFYKVHFTDPSENAGTGGFIIEPRAQDGPKSPVSSLPFTSSTLTISTPIKFHGKGSPNYGEPMADAILNVLENFASPIAPLKPVNGMIWYDTGKSFKILSFDNANQITVEGNVVSEVLEMIYGAVDPHNPWPINRTTFRLVNVDYADENPAVVGIVPTNAVLVGSNTSITVDQTPFDGVSSVGQSYVVTDANRKILKVWDKTANAWINANGAYVGEVEPYQPMAGDLWIDTSSSPASFRYYDGYSFSAGLLSLGGGTLTGSLFLFADPTSPLEAATKQYVDGLVDSIAGAGSPTASISDIYAALITTQNDLVVLTNRVSINESNIITLTNAVSGLSISVGNKYDKVGGVLSGNAIFNVPESNVSFGIKFQGLDSISDITFDINAIGDTTKGYLDTTLTSPTTNVASRIVYDNTSTSTVVSEFRTNGIIAPLGVYEVDPSLYPLGSTLPANKRLITNEYFSTQMTLRGNVVNSATFDDATKQLLMLTTQMSNGALGSPVPVDLTHTHPELAPETYDVAPVDSLFEDVHQLDQVGKYQSGVKPNSIIRWLDNDKISKRNPLVINEVPAYKRLTPTTINYVSDLITLDPSDVINYDINVGDTVNLAFNGSFGFNSITYSSAPTFESSTVLQWLNPNTIVSAIFTIDNAMEVTVQIDTSVVTTLGVLVDAISEQINNPLGLSPAPIAVINISINNVTKNLTFDSNLYSADSGVGIVDVDLFINLFAGASPAFGPDLFSELGIRGDEPAIVQEVSVTSKNLNVIEVSPPIAGLEIDEVWVVSIPQELQHLASKKYIDNHLGNNVVTVNSLYDFPEPVAGVITLADNTTYIVHGVIDLLTNRLVIGSNTRLTGRNRFADGLTYSGADAMLTSSQTHTINELSIYQTNPAGKVFDMYADQTKTLIYQNSYTYQCYTVGDFGDWRNISFRSFSVVNSLTTGITLHNRIQEMYISESAYLNNAGTALDLGTCALTKFVVGGQSRFVVPLGAVGINAAINSGNFTTTLEDDGHIHENYFDGDGTYITGIARNDIRWHVSEVHGFSTITNAQGYINDSALNTTFADTTNYVKVNFGAAYVPTKQNRFTVDSSGRYTYIGLHSIDVVVDCTTFAIVSGGVARQYEYRLFVNGANVYPSSSSRDQYDGSSPASTICSAIVSLEPGDYVELYVRALTDTTSLNVINSSMRISQHS